jgi:hypothetical protein
MIDRVAATARPNGSGTLHRLASSLHGIAVDPFPHPIAPRLPPEAQTLPVQ